MPVQINEVVIRAVITNENCGDSSKCGPQQAASGTTVNDAPGKDILELIDEVLTQKKER